MKALIWIIGVATQCIMVANAKQDEETQVFREGCVPLVADVRKTWSARRIEFHINPDDRRLADLKALIYREMQRVNEARFRNRSDVPKAAETIYRSNTAVYEYEVSYGRRGIGFNLLVHKGSYWHAVSVTARCDLTWLAEELRPYHLIPYHLQRRAPGQY